MNAKTLVENLIASLIVSFVALSLGASFGILSGRENAVFVGMLSAGVIAFITALLGGTRIQCSGPTAPMTAVTVLVVAFAHDRYIAENTQGNPDHFVNIVLILTGAVLVLMAILKLGKYIKYVPNVVVSGFMTGIAILIWVDQIRKITGLGGTTPYSGSIATNIIVAASTLILIFLIPLITQRYIPKYKSYFSPTLLSIIIITAIANILRLDIEHVNLEASFSSFSGFVAMIKSQVPAEWSWQTLRMAIPFALQLAFLAYLDTLLTSLVVDKLSKETTHRNKELAAQGVANSLVAFIGGIPGAQATIRSVLIIKENATMRLAGVMVGVFMFIEIVLFKEYMNFIPQAVFVGVLFKVGYDVFDFMPFELYMEELKRYKWSIFKDLFSSHKQEKIFITNREMMLILGTILVTLFVNLNAAVFGFTIVFYLANKILWRKNPIRDLQPGIESRGIGEVEKVITEDPEQR